jgi:mannose-6-phosphate isomerase-like protein (cupin superfamily)
VSWQTAHVRPTIDALAPDGSEIRLLVQVSGASLVHCTLPPGGVTRAVRHRSVEEVWLCLAGRGRLWRHCASTDEIVNLEPGVAVTIPLGSDFQFRTVGQIPLELAITTIPPWPGNDEAAPVDGMWQASV